MKSKDYLLLVMIKLVEIQLFVDCYRGRHITEGDLIWNLIAMHVPPLSLKDAIDTHMHTGPDIYPRLGDGDRCR